MAKHTITDFKPERESPSLVACICGWHWTNPLQLSRYHAADSLLDKWLDHFKPVKSAANVGG